MFHCQHHEKKPKEKEGHGRIQVKYHPCAPVYSVYCVLPTSVMDLIHKKGRLTDLAYITFLYEIFLESGPELKKNSVNSPKPFIKIQIVLQTFFCH